MAYDHALSAQMSGMWRYLVEVGRGEERRVIHDIVKALYAVDEGLHGRNVLQSDANERFILLCVCSLSSNC